MDNAERIREQERQRFKFLQAVYEATAGDPKASVKVEPLFEELSIGPEEAATIKNRLSAEGLIKYYCNTPLMYTITIPGLRTVESALLNPDEPVGGFPPLNVIFVGEMHDSQISQGEGGDHER